jgi:hypothetical protein
VRSRLQTSAHTRQATEHLIAIARRLEKMVAQYKL